MALLLLSAIGAQAATYNIRDFGAKADKTTNDAPAMQAAMDACNRDGGGDVIVPSGNYLIGHLDLRSNVTLVLQDGAHLWASSRWEDYEKSAKGKLDIYLISGDGLENVALTGEGEIHGLGHADLGGGTSNPNDDRITKYVRQPTYIALANIDGLVVDDVRVLINDDVFKQFDRSAVAVFNSRDGVITNVERRPDGAAGGQPVVALTDCTGCASDSCRSRVKRRPVT